MDLKTKSKSDIKIVARLDIRRTPFVYSSHPSSSHHVSKTRRKRRGSVIDYNGDNPPCLPRCFRNATTLRSLHLSRTHQPPPSLHSTTLLRIHCSVHASHAILPHTSLPHILIHPRIIPILRLFQQSQLLDLHDVRESV